MLELERDGAAIKIQGFFFRRHLSRRKIGREKVEQEAALNALKNEEEQTLLKGKHEKEQARLRIKALLEEEQRTQEFAVIYWRLLVVGVKVWNQCGSLEEVVRARKTSFGRYRDPR